MITLSLNQNHRFAEKSGTKDAFQRFSRVSLGATSARHVPDERAAEKSQIQTRHGADGKYGERPQVQRIPRTFSRQTGTHTFRPVDRPRSCVQGTQEDTERERQTVPRAYVGIRFGARRH